MPKKKRKVKLGLKNLAMLPSYFDYIFVHLRQKVRLWPEKSPKFLSPLDPNPTRTRARPEKPGPTYNSGSYDKVSSQAAVLLYKSLYSNYFCSMALNKQYNNWQSPKPKHLEAQSIQETSSNSARRTTPSSLNPCYRRIKWQSSNSLFQEEKNC